MAMETAEAEIQEYEKKIAKLEETEEAKTKCVTKASQINTMLNEVNDGMNPNIETYAKPRVNVTQSNESSDGLVHSFSVEIKTLKNGPIPDTQLMSKILQSIENHSTSQYADGMEDGGNEFEVVSFKYERREDKKNTK